MKYLTSGQLLHRNDGAENTGGDQHPPKPAFKAPEFFSGANDFVKDISGPTRSSVDTAGTTTPEIKITPGNLAEPADMDASGPAPAPIHIPRPAGDTAGTSGPAATVRNAGIRQFLESKNALQGLGFGLYAGDYDFKQFMYPEQVLKQLELVYAPFADTVSGMLPPEFNLIIMEGANLVPIALAAHKIRQQKDHEKQVMRNNAAMQQNPAAAQHMQPAQAPATDKKRSSYKLNKKGWYYSDRNGNYVKETDPKEMVDLRNRDHVKEVIGANGWQMFSSLYAVDENYLASIGLDLQQIKEEYGHE